MLQVNLYQGWGLIFYISYYVVMEDCHQYTTVLLKYVQQLQQLRLLPFKSLLYHVY